MARPIPADSARLRLAARRSSRRALLALFAKAPVPGRVKTRLCPPLSPVQSAALYEAMLLDILDQPPPACGPERVLWFTPPEAEGWFRGILPRGFGLRAQQGADLATRMRHLFRAHAREGFGRIVLRGTDSPTLPLSRLEDAFQALERADLVLGPDRDGGYSLIGLRQPCDALFEVEMSTGHVLERTLEQASREGLRSALLSSHHDVDGPEDLRRLEAEVSPSTTPRTLRWLREVRGSIAE